MLPARGNPRILALAAFVNTFGNGAYLATSVLFLTRVIGLHPAVMALGLSIGAGAGIVLTTPLGYVADRFGPKNVQIGALLALAFAFAALLTVRGLLSFALVACVISVGSAAVKGANGALAAGSVRPEDRLIVRAQLRSVTNAGIGLGTLAGGIPLLLDNRSAYTVVLLGNAISFLATAAIVSRTTPVPPQVTPPGMHRMTVMRDRAFMTFATLDGLITSLFNELLGLALPLWLVARTHAPLWLISAALLVNTLGCVLLQVWATRSADGISSSGRLAKRGTALIGTSCLLFGAAGGITGALPSVAVGALVLSAAVVHVLGELWMSTASWAVVFGLAPDWAQGQYQGMYFTGRQVGDFVAPPLLTLCVVGLGGYGWVALAVLFAVAGLAYPALIAWGVRTRPVARGASAVPQQVGECVSHVVVDECARHQPGNVGRIAGEGVQVTVLPRQDEVGAVGDGLGGSQRGVVVRGDQRGSVG